MLQAINTKILLSAAVILAAAAVIVGATFAFFADTETSTANTLAAGELDLKVDSEAHYAGLVCSEVSEGIYHWIDDPAVDAPTTRPELLDTECEGTWSETDLTQDNIFFALSDIKPGDSGENTISLHVYDNDAWGRMVVTTTADDDNGCTEPETEDGDLDCNAGEGELRENLLFTAWLDQGATPGFQNINAEGVAIDTDENTPGIQAPDPTEGDNIHQVDDEPIVITQGTVDENPANETFEFAEGLATVYELEECTDVDGNTNYGSCHGLAEDGRMVGSTTYYMGVLWTLPGETTNIVQSDSFVANVSFDVLQHRNNPNPVFE